MPGVFIANTLDEQPETVPVAPMAPAPPGGTLPPPPAHNGPAYWIKVSAQQDGTFTVTNSRNGFVKTYRAEAAPSGEDRQPETCGEHRNQERPEPVGAQCPRDSAVQGSAPIATKHETSGLPFSREALRRHPMLITIFSDYV